MIQFFPILFVDVVHKIPWRNENAVYRLQLSALFLEIFKFEISVTYAN